MANLNLIWPTTNTENKPIFSEEKMKICVVSLESATFHPLSIKKLKNWASVKLVSHWNFFSALICGYFCDRHFRHSWFFDFTSSTGCYGWSVVIYKSSYTTTSFQNLKKTFDFFCLFGQSRNFFTRIWKNIIIYAWFCVHLPYVT